MLKTTGGGGRGGGGGCVTAKIKKKSYLKIKWKLNQDFVVSLFVKTGRPVRAVIRPGVQPVDRIRRTKATHSALVSGNRRLYRIQHNGHNILSGRKGSGQPDGSISRRSCWNSGICDQCRLSGIRSDESHRSGHQPRILPTVPIVFHVVRSTRIPRHRHCRTNREQDLEGYRW